MNTNDLAVEVTHVQKSFGKVQAVKDVSFHVQRGEIFGLLGPNGAGKTTTIRLMLDIFKPERGAISILGGPMDETKKERIGYMPEERGLYQDIRLEQMLVYLASLKGVPLQEAKRRVAEYLERFDLTAYKKKKVKTLSKGMQQKAQIIATLLHRPELIIVDEPFSGLDPVNTRMVKNLLYELNQQGATIIMSTHQMHQVEELCDRILLVNQGEAVLYGEVHTIRRQYSGNAVLVRTEDLPLPCVPGVELMEKRNGSMLLNLSPGMTPQSVLRELVSREITLEQFEVALPSLDEIFVRVVQGEGAVRV